MRINVQGIRLRLDCFVPRNDGEENRKRSPVTANARPVIANAVKQSRRRRNLDCFVPRNDGEKNRNDGFRWRGLAARADNDDATSIIN
jgi:hypothetical protein